MEKIQIFVPECLHAMNDGSGVDNWSYTACKVPVKSSPTTNQHPQ